MTGAAISGSHDMESAGIAPTRTLGEPARRVAIPRGVWLAAALWRDLPVWFLAYLGWSLCHFTLKSLDPPHPQFAWTALFPLTVVTVFLWRVRGPVTRERFVRTVFLVFAPLALLVALPRHPLTPEAAKLAFEISTGAWVGLLALHCALTRPFTDFRLFFGIGAVYGLILENGGIILGFFREPGYVLHIPPFPGPVVTALGWVTVLYCATHVAEHLPEPRGHRAPWKPALVATAVALALDLQLDPVATAAGWWVWDTTLIAFPGLMGVPIVNFTAWIGATLPFFYLLWWIRSEGLPPWRQNAMLVLCLAPLLVVELMLVIVLTALVDGGLASPAVILFSRSLSSTVVLAVLVAGCALLAVAARIHRRTRRRAATQHLAEVFRLALCSEVVSECSQIPVDERDLRDRIMTPHREFPDPHQAFREAVGHCLERGWIEGPPEARRATAEGQQVALALRAAIR